MTPNEKNAVTYFNNEMDKTKKNMLKILRNESQMTDDEFSKYMFTELTRYDRCRYMRDYYISDYSAGGCV